MNWTRSVFFSALVVLAFGSAAGAWDSPGHEQIADIAWSQLNAKAKQEITAILQAGDSNFRPSSAREDSVRSAFRRAATFPDYIRSHQDTAYEAELIRFNQKWDPEHDPLVSKNERVRCKTWHYYDTPIRFQGEKPKVARSNAMTALGFARSELTRLEKARTPNRRMQCWWLYWIEHVTGDLHQPLHCTSSYDSGKGDDGGNGFKLGLPDPRDPSAQMPLHAYWDAGIDHVKQAEKAQGQAVRVDQVTARWNGDGVLAPSAAEAKDLKVEHWLAEGAKLADQKVYTGIDRGGTPTAEYAAEQATVCKRQALLAGYRLANLLNGILGK